MSANSASEKINLARIRDNQRRSRARRKEYLQELEEKYRNCELLGVEASSEIQAAARRVAEENKRLRALLRSRGVMDGEIDLYMAEDSPTDPPRAVALEGMLREKRSCNGDKPGCGLPNSDLFTARSQPALDPNLEQSHYVGHVRSLQTPVAMSTQPSISPTQTSGGSYSTPEYYIPQSSYEQPRQPDWADPQFELGDDAYTDFNTSSCTFAANVVTSMSQGVSTDQVKSEFGCRSDVECKVDNTTLFNVMDRYTG